MMTPTSGCVSDMITGSITTGDGSREREREPGQDRDRGNPTARWAGPSPRLPAADAATIHNRLVSSLLSNLDLTRLRPRLLDALASGYTSNQLTSDVIAGLTVGLVALPLAMAFGIASGTTPRPGSTRPSSAACSSRSSGGSQRPDRRTRPARSS